MKPIAVFDVETDPFRAGRMPEPFCAGFFDGSRTQVFWGKTCVARCWQVMRKFKGYIYAHNGGKFDFKYLLPHLPINSVKVHNIKGRIAKISFGELELRDSYCMLPIPLAQYGKSKIDYNKFETGEREANRAEIIAYLKDDLRYTHRMISEFIAEYGFGLTMAGRTFAQLKERFEIVPPKTDENYDARYRRYYYGGRVEFFELGHIKGNFDIYDINSAYPYAMLSKHVFGTSFISAAVVPSNPDILRNCFISFIGESNGALPYHADDGSLCFKPRRGEFHVTGWELLAGLETGNVKIDRVLICHRPLELRDFSTYVNHFYRIKREAAKGSSEETFAKLMLNSCYGRFALNPREFKDVCLTDYGDEPDENKKARKAGKDEPWALANDFEDVGISIWEKPAPIQANSFFNVATAASITGFVRAYLFRALAACRRAVYCDTDCIIAEGANHLEGGRELGQWKHEGKIAPDSLWIAGKKLYAAKLDSGKWKTAAKGVRLPPTDICRIANGEAITSTLDAPSFSLLSGERFVTRTVRRDDQRKRRNTKSK